MGKQLDNETLVYEVELNPGCCLFEMDTLTGVTGKHIFHFL